LIVNNIDLIVSLISAASSFDLVSSSDHDDQNEKKDAKSVQPIHRKTNWSEIELVSFLTEIDRDDPPPLLEYRIDTESASVIRGENV